MMYEGTLVKVKHREDARVAEYRALIPTGEEYGPEEFQSPPQVGYCFFLGGLCTTPVTKIVKTDNKVILFKTENSLYKLQIHKVIE